MNQCGVWLPPGFRADRLGQYQITDDTVCAKLTLNKARVPSQTLMTNVYSNIALFDITWVSEHVTRWKASYVLVCRAVQRSWEFITVNRTLSKCFV